MAPDRLSVASACGKLLSQAGGSGPDRSAMQVFFHEAQRQHDPQHFLVAGTLRPSPEQPARTDALLAAVRNLGLQVQTPGDRGMAPIAAVHSTDYLRFLQTIHERWSALPGAGPEVVPNIHPDSLPVAYPVHPAGLAGCHQADTACPIGPHTWHSAYWSAQTAIAAADAVLRGAASAYALCRPPGHHATSDRAGGFCFLSNAAIAAERCLRAGRRPAVLDIDLHHGNGTQQVFYERRDVLTVSIHADPSRFYPFFWGHAGERGAGPGHGYNLNLPLALGTGDDGFLAALAEASERIRLFGADLLVLAVGLDAFEGDPFAGLAVTTGGFGRIATACVSLGLPTVLVQEGGYLSPELTRNLESFLASWLRPAPSGR
jgi:acetoin utilization deacetylase AcuC-like enzyme